MLQTIYGENVLQGLTNLRMYESKIQYIRNDIRLLLQGTLPKSKNHRYEIRDKEQRPYKCSGL